MKIQNCSISVGSISVLHNINLNFFSQKIHVLVGPNGSGKSSLACAIMGHPEYQVIKGMIHFETKELCHFSVFQRSLLGLYLAMQQVQEVPGLQNLVFLKEICSVHRKKTITIHDFLNEVRPLLSMLGLAESILYRSVHEGFSGGEKKRFELLQMFLIKPKIAILDEIDSGVDIDGLKLIAQSLLWYKKENPEISMVLITHYRRILDYLNPDFVHVLMNGYLVKTGGKEILDQIEKNGYEIYAKRSE